MDISLQGKTALVTGGSRGIGKAIAATFVRCGANVMIVSRKEDSLRATAEEIGGNIAYIAANTGDVDSAESVVQQTLAKFGAIDIFVNNAATNPYAGPMMDVDQSRYDKTFQVNLRGPVFWTQSVWKHWMKDHPGVIVNIASIGGLRTEASLGVYNLTKAAIIHMTRQLAGELGATRVVGIAPGLIVTDFAQMLVDNFGTSATVATTEPTRYGALSPNEWAMKPPARDPRALKPVPMNR
ncbi:MAG: SDR family oxidoreductase [Actinobacteria bacterium]|nr:SDR family oxidoreductase [Actinomycetota bacterium]